MCIFWQVKNANALVIDSQRLQFGILAGGQEQTTKLAAGPGGQYFFDLLHIIAHGNDAHPFLAKRLEHLVGIQPQLVCKGRSHSAVEANAVRFPFFRFCNVEAAGIDVVSVGAIGAALIEKLAQTLSDTGKRCFCQQCFAVNPAVCGFRGVVFSEDPAHIPGQR